MKKLLSRRGASIYATIPSFLLVATVIQPALAESPAVVQATTPDNAPFPGIPLPAVPEKLLNKWPEAEERAFEERAKTRPLRISRFIFSSRAMRHCKRKTASGFGKWKRPGWLCGPSI